MGTPYISFVYLNPIINNQIWCVRFLILLLKKLSIKMRSNIEHMIYMERTSVAESARKFLPYLYPFQKLCGGPARREVDTSFTQYSLFIPLQ